MSELLTVDMIKPTARCVKDQEMAVRRAYQLNVALIDILKQEGNIKGVKESGRFYILTHPELRKIYTYMSPEYIYRDVWEWVVDHWYSGALKRSVEATMDNITSTNKKAIKGKINDLHG